MLFRASLEVLWTKRVDKRKFALGIAAVILFSGTERSRSAVKR